MAEQLVLEFKGSGVFDEIRKSTLKSFLESEQGKQCYSRLYETLSPCSQYQLVSQLQSEDIRELDIIKSDLYLRSQETLQLIEKELERLVYPERIPNESFVVVKLEREYFKMSVVDFDPLENVYTCKNPYFKVESRHVIPLPDIPVNDDWSIEPRLVQHMF